jgi:hypothetical protein
MPGVRPEDIAWMYPRDLLGAEELFNVRYPVAD